MNDYKPEINHRVHVEFDATVRRDDGDGTWLVHPLDSERNFPVFVMPQHMTRLPDPEPTWQPGDLVIDANGKYWTRMAECQGVTHVFSWSAGAWSSDQVFHGDWERENTPVRPLIPLVRDGKPWIEDTP